MRPLAAKSRGLLIVKLKSISCRRYAKAFFLMPGFNVRAKRKYISGRGQRGKRDFQRLLSGSKRSKSPPCRRCAVYRFDWESILKREHRPMAWSAVADRHNMSVPKRREQCTSSRPKESTRLKAVGCGSSWINQSSLAAVAAGVRVGVDVGRGVAVDSGYCATISLALF